jgi:hypothetical protein
MQDTGLPDGLIDTPKIQIWVIFGWSCNGRCWYILWTFGLPILQPSGKLY